MRLKKLKVQDAVGHVLCHDMTQIIPGESKGPRFRKGHIVAPEDVDVLLSMGKRSVYVWQTAPDMVHEDDAACQLCQLVEGPGCTHAPDVREGKALVTASCDGCLRVRSDALVAMNYVEGIIISTRRGNCAVCEGDSVAGMRVIPLVIEQETLDLAAAAAGSDPVCEVVPFRLRSAGVVTTGSEVACGLIEDAFTPVVRNKLAAYGIEVVANELPGDEVADVAAAIGRMRERGVDIVLCTGGMSVDADDNTPAAIQRSGAEILTYGVPVLPGSMLLMGYFDDNTPVLGLPGGVMSATTTAFDLMLPRIAAGIRLSRAELVAYGEGGLLEA